MKSVFITLSPTKANLPHFLLGLGMGFEQWGYKVFLIFDRQQIPENIPKSITTYAWPSYRPTKPRDFLFMLKLIKKYKPQIIIASFGAVNISMMAARFMNVSYRVAWYHTKSSQIASDSTVPIFKRRFLRIRKSIILRFFANYILTNSHSSKEDAAWYLGIPEDCILVVPYLITHSKIEGNIEKENQILFIGRLYPSKGQEKFIKSIPYISKKYPSYKFIFLGQGPEYENLKKLISELGISAICELRGSVSLQEVYNELAKSKIHVSASSDEAFGLVNVEALSMATVVLGPKVGGIKDIIIEDYNGYFIDINDPQDIFSKVDKVLRDNENFTKLSGQAFITFENNYEMTLKNLKKETGRILQFVQ